MVALMVLALPPSYPTFCIFPASTHLWMHKMCLFELISCSCNVASPTDTQRYHDTHTLSHTHLLPHIPPHTPLSIDSLCQPTSKCMKQVHLNLFCLSITFLALWKHENTTMPTLSATPPSYPTYHLFPVSTPPPNACNQFIQSCFMFA